MKHVVRGRSVFFTDEHLEAEAAPGEMVTHAAGSVGLDHGGNACGFENTFSEVGFGLGGEGIYDYEFAAIHALIICQSATSGGVWNEDTLNRAFSGRASPIPTAFWYADSSLAHPSARFGEASISQNRAESRYNPRLSLSK